MRRLTLLFPLFFLLVSLSCRSGNDVIVEMRSRKITRAEFHQWLQARDVDPDRVYMDRAESEKYLRQMSVEMLAVESALAEKFDETPFYRNVNRAVFANLLSLCYRTEIKKNLNYNERAAEIKLIRLFFPPDQNNQLNRDILKDKLSLASHIIRQDKSGIDFDDLRRKYSEEYTRPEKTSQVIPVEILEKEIFQTIKTLYDGECAAEPALLRDSVAVVKLVRWLSIDRDNAQKLIDNVEIYNRFMDAISEGAIEYIIAENSSALNIDSNIGRAKFTGRNELLFSINGQSFTSGDLADLLNLFIFLKSEWPDEAREPVVKKEIALNIFNEYLLSHLAEKKGISSSSDFLYRWEYVRRSTLSGAYKYSILSGKCGRGEGLCDWQKPLSSGEESKKGAADLSGRDVASIKNTWENGLLKSNEFRIHKQELD